MNDELKPVAWMWKYIGDDPIGSHIHPSARSLHEMDPHNPPYPNHWKPLHPLYATALQQERIKALEEALRELLAAHTESMGFSMSMACDRAQFDAFLERAQTRVDEAVAAAQSALENKQ